MKKIIFTTILLIAANAIFAQKALKVLLDDGTIRHYPTSEVTELIFVDDACDGVRSLTYGRQLYTTVQIGSQCWLEQNLNIGTRIGLSTESSNNSTVEKYCYDDDEDYCNVFGGLYQWAEAVQYLNGATNITSPNPAFSGNVQGICPTGWHIPTNGELTELQTSVGGSGYANALKAVGQGYWFGAGTNTSGFSVLLAGYWSYDVNFGNLGSGAYFWSSTEYGATDAYFMYLYGNNSDVGLGYSSKDYGFSVRCLKD